MRGRESGRGGGGGEAVLEENAEEASENEVPRSGMWMVGLEGAVLGRGFTSAVVIVSRAEERSGRGGAGNGSAAVFVSWWFLSMTTVPGTFRSWV